MKNFYIHCQNVSFRYIIRQGHTAIAHHDALRDLTFSIEDQERVGIIGANGAGKSTLLRVLAGILYQTSGKISRGGNPHCAFLTIAGNWYPNLSGRENAILACLMSGLRRREAEERLAAIGEFAELGEWLDRPVRTYSSGMTARLGLATALQTCPDVLLLDEVLSVGDARFRQKAAKAVKETMSRARSVVLVSHDSSTLASMCDRVLWLEHGHLKKDGPAKEVLAEYSKWVVSQGLAAKP